MGSELSSSKSIKWSNNLNYTSAKESTDTSNIKYRRHYCSLISKATFCWFTSILKLGYSRPLQLNDLAQLPHEEMAEFQFSRFLRCIKDEKKLSALNLWSYYWQTYRLSLITGACIKVLADLFGLVGPLSISLIISYVNQTQTDAQSVSLSKPNFTNYTNHTIETLIQPETHWLYFSSVSQVLTNGYVIAFFVLLATIMQSTFSNNFNHLVIAEGIHLKTALQCLVYKKSLSISSHSVMDMGANVNYMSIDSFNMFMLFSMGHYLWAVPFKILLLLYLLHYQLGYSALIGAATIYILAPIQYYISTQLSKLQKKELETADERLRKTSELFMGIKLLKLLGWELAFADAINEIREEEIKILRRDSIYIALNTFTTQASSIIVTLVTFSLYSYIEGESLTSAKVFTGLALFNQLTVPLYIIPMVIPILISAILSTRRLAEFLSSPSIDSYIPWKHGQQYARQNSGNDEVKAENNHQSSRKSSKLNRLRSRSPNERLCCRISGASFGLATDLGSNLMSTLTDISVGIPEGRLTIIVGTVGSGKSSFLYSLLGELRLLRGHVGWYDRNDLIGYVPDKPWLINLTLQENITFGLPMDSKRYKQVLSSCALEDDIEILPLGDLTELGDRGINLSGGQKQRIALARAIYSPAKTLILDDPLSALDPHVGQHVFDNAIQELLVGQKRTVILVTNTLEYLPHAANIIVFDSGTISHQGNYKEIEYLDPDLFAVWSAARQREAEARKNVALHESGTANERKKLMRLLSKQVAFRGCIPNKRQPRRRRNLSFTRQMSHDPSSPLPCHDWSDHDDEHLHHNHQTIEECTASLVSRKFRSATFLRMRSIDSAESKSSLGHSSSMLSSSPDSIVNLSRQPLVRLNSRISDYSFSGNSIKEENEDEDDEQEFDNDNDLFFDDASQEFGRERSVSVATRGMGGEEERQTGSISKRIYISYMKACSYSLTAIVLSLIVVTHSVKVLSDFWLAKWSKASESWAETDTDLTHYIKGYAALSLITIVISFATNLSSQLTSIRAVRQLHANLLNTLVRCPMKFFDVTPFGRILSRFSNDVNVIDKKLPIALPVLLRFLLLCVSAIVVDIIITPYFVIAVIPIIVIYYLLQHFFRYTSRELQRLDLITKSPILSHYSQTISGLTTIRAFAKQNDFTIKFYEYLDANNLCFLMVNAANCWLGIALDYLGGIILFIATVASISAAIYGSLSAAYVGMTMTYTLLVPIYLNWMIRNLASVEMYMNSVERLDHYSSLPIEDSDATVLVAVPDEWPKNGAIQFDNVYLKYDSTAEPVVKGVTFEIKAGEKVGICGRTGCGKSTLIGALFRINQISDGSIRIDGVDISLVSSQALRSRLSIIPQDVILFSGTIRQNLDPSNVHTDDEIWSILSQLNLNNTVLSLDEIVTEEGQNFSIGQRQLLCAARALLRRSSILIMDEATSSLDADTQQLITSIVATLSKTVVSIAHRLDNLIHFDKIVVLDSGAIAEIGSPQTLLDNKNSLFYSLVNQNKT